MLLQTIQFRIPIKSKYNTEHRTQRLGRLDRAVHTGVPITLPKARIDTAVSGVLTHVRTPSIHPFNLPDAAHLKQQLDTGYEGQHQEHLQTVLRASANNTKNIQSTGAGTGTGTENTKRSIKNICKQHQEQCRAIA